MANGSPYSLAGTQKPTESVAMHVIVPLIFMVSGAIIESNVES